MAHAVYSRDLGRNSSWRKATVRSLAQALLTRERIRTTHAKAKEAQRLTERLITLGKSGTLLARRRAISLLADPVTVKRLFVEIAPRFEKRAGGYTRIMHASPRPGDGASMSVIELVELSPDLQVKEKSKDKQKAAGKPAETPKEKGRARPAAAEPKSKKAAPAVSVNQPEPVEAKPELPKPAEQKKQPPESVPGKEKPKTGLVAGLRKFLKGRGDKSP